MMEHLNYCRQIAMQCSDLLTVPSLAPEKREQFQHIVTLAAVSQKFILPPGGRLLDDRELRAIDPSEPLRLPYPFIALESEVPLGWIEGPHISKEAVFAWEVDKGVLVRRIGYSRTMGAWGMGDIVALPKEGYLEATVDGVRQMRVHPWIDRAQGPEEAIDTHGASNVLCFLNALACSNVHTEKSDARKPKKSAKSALPFDSYYFLTIDVPGTQNGGGVSTGLHRSPREHLRRGHIRRLQDGRRIWVNATVVAAGNKGGKIEKDYRLRAA